MLQDTPISVQAFTAAEIERLGITDMTDVISLSPSLVFEQASNPEASTITIRGLNPSRGRANAAILVDGVDVTTEAIGSSGGGMLINTHLLDIERVEIVRGPQAVEYGRSAFAGAIQYVTADPTEEASGRVSAQFDEDGGNNLGLSFSASPLPGVFGFRVGVNSWREKGDYVDEALLSEHGGASGGGVALSTLLTPTENLRMKTRLEYFESQSAPEAQVLLRSNSGLVNATNNTNFATARTAGVISASPFAVWTGVVPDASEVGLPQMSPDPVTGQRFAGTERDAFRFSNVLDYDVGHGEVRGVVSYLHGNFYSRQDSDKDAELSGTPGSMIDVSRRTGVQESSSEVDQYTLELRYASDWDGPIQVVLGGLYWKEESERISSTVSVTCANTVALCAVNPNPVFDQIVYVPDPTTRAIEHTSFYGQVAWDISSTLSLSIGARYVSEDETVMGAVCGLPTNAFGVVCGDPYATSAATPSVYGPSSLLANRITMASAYSQYVTIDHSESYVTPQVILEWNPSDDHMLYVSASEGVKPGGTSTVGAGAWFDSDLDGDTDELAYERESVWVYEVGAKSAWLGGRLRTNAALFYQDYTNQQVATSVATPSGLNAAIIQNAGASRVYGLELEGRLRVTNHLTLSAAYTYLDAEYVDFTFASDSKSQIILGPECNVITVGTTPMCEIRLGGNKLERAPENAAVVMARYDRPDSFIGPEIGWYLEGTVTYQGERFVDQFNTRVLQDYTLTDIRFGLTSDAWTLGFFVNNVFDDDTIRQADVRTGDVDRYVVGGGVASSTNVVLVTLPDPRTYGMRLSYRF
ncbi:MAG: TonB-dependent receptor [Terricaulis sp.]|nr:TonB-dependent receptor [Terricaulis sp.]